MVPQKRKLMVVSGAIAAAFALPGCAPQGYKAADYGAAAAPDAKAAGNVVEAQPTATATAAPAGDLGGADSKAPTLSDAEITTSLTAKTVPRMGSVVVDNNGWTLYRFDKDKANPSESTCNDKCAKIWPPALTDSTPELSGVAADDVGTVDRADGTKQITLAGWPLYRYIGDKKKGQWKGQNVAGTWFVIKPNGSKNLTCLPAISKPVAPPSDGEKQKASSDSGTAYNY